MKGGTPLAGGRPARKEQSSNQFVRADREKLLESIPMAIKTFEGAKEVLKRKIIILEEGYDMEELSLRNLSNALLLLVLYDRINTEVKEGMRAIAICMEQVVIATKEDRMEKLVASKLDRMAERVYECTEAVRDFNYDKVDRALEVVGLDKVIEQIETSGDILYERLEVVHELLKEGNKKEQRSYAEAAAMGPALAAAGPKGPRSMENRELVSIAEIKERA